MVRIIRCFFRRVRQPVSVYLPEFTTSLFDATDEKVIYTAVNNGIPNIYSVDIKDWTMQKLTENGAIFPASFRRKE
jgi:hypothetical protein